MLIALKRKQQFRSRVAMCCVGAALLVESTNALATRNSESSAERPRSTRSDQSIELNPRRLREGTIVSDQNGFFREDGDGATFVADTGMEFGALPNLNLERVVRLLKSAEESSSIRWSVTGKVTEFSGRNYLLVTRALYKSAAPPPVPDRLSH